MANIDLLISKLDHRLRSLHQEQLVAKANGTDSLEQRYISNYIQITKTGNINPGIEFTILDALSKHFNLYENDLERQQILAAMAGELKNASRRDLLASTKIIQNTYPSIYLLTQESLNQNIASSLPIIVKVFLTLDTRSKLIVGVAVLISATILGGKISSIFNRSLDPNPSTPATSLATPDQTVVTQQIPLPGQTVAAQQVSNINSEPVITADRQSGLSVITYQSHCTLQSNQNQLEDVIDDNCSISQTLDKKNYTLNLTNGDVYHVELITDNQAIVNGEQATRVVQKDSSEIAMIFSKGRVGWNLKG